MSEKLFKDSVVKLLAAKMKTTFRSDNKETRFQKLVAAASENMPEVATHEFDYLMRRLFVGELYLRKGRPNRAAGKILKTATVLVGGKTTEFSLVENKVGFVHAYYCPAKP